MRCIRRFRCLGYPIMLAHRHESPKTARRAKCSAGTIQIFRPVTVARSVRMRRKWEPSQNRRRQTSQVAKRSCCSRPLSDRRSSTSALLAEVGGEVEMDIGIRLQPGITLSRQRKIPSSDATSAFGRLPTRATPGQLLPLHVSRKRTTDRPLHSATCRMPCVLSAFR